VNGRQAKYLRSLARYNPNESREYENVLVAKKKFIRFETNGKSKEIVKERFQLINKSKQEYNRWKKAYYLTKKQGGL